MMRSVFSKVAALRLMLVLGLVLLAAAPALAAGRQNFTLINKTGYTIDQVYVSATSAKDWEEDILGQDVLSNGESVDITFDRGESACKWDLKVVYDDQSESEWGGLNLCKISKVSIHYDRKKDKTWAVYE